MSNKLIELVFDRVMNRKFTLLRKIALTFFSSPSANRSRMAQTGNGAQPGLDELNEVALSLDDGGKLSGQLCDLFYFRLALWTSCHHHYYLFQWACYVILNKWHGHGDWCRYYLIVTGLLSMLRKIQRRRRRERNQRTPDVPASSGTSWKLTEGLEAVSQTIFEGDRSCIWRWHNHGNFQGI